MHDDPGRACRDFLSVLDHWERVGDWSQQWIALRYVVRLLARVDAAEAAVTLHAALGASGRPSPLDAARLGRVLGDERYAVRLYDLAADRTELTDRSGACVVDRRRRH